MTIKKRLVLSNTLMILFPLIIALLIAALSLKLTYDWIDQEARKEKSVYDSYEDIAKTVVAKLEEQKSEEDMNTYLKDYSVNVYVLDPKGREYYYGTESLKYETLLIQNGVGMHWNGFAYVNEETIYALQTKGSEGSYQIGILFNDYEIYDNNSRVNKAIDLQIPIVGGATLVGILISIAAANYFLSRFVFRRINRSLNLLIQGLGHINEGNLDYRIVYTKGDDFAPAYDDFNKMASRLKESIALTQKQEQNRKELIAGISHDIRSPLTSIRAYVEGLIDGVAQTPEAQHSYMMIIKTKAEEIEQMVSKLFLFSKMDMGDFPYDPELLDLASEIRSYLQATSVDYKQKGLNITTCSLSEKALVYVDPLQLRRILMNVFENSIKYKDQPEVQEAITLEVQEDKVVLRLEDDGPGVPEEDVTKIFQVFYRGDAARSNPNKGSGLGLAITAKAVAYMGGNIYAQRRLPKGLCIVVELPLQKEEIVG